MTSGGCLCKAVRYTFPSRPIAARLCWCRLCQYLSGGNGMASVGFHTDGLEIQGQVTWYASTADSGNRMSRGFCATCGTPLFSKAGARPQVIFVRAGSLDDPNAMAPEINIWTREAPKWACMDPALPKVEGQPPPLK
jgi:hypothetical protein